MSTQLSYLLFSIGVAGLFFFDRNKSIKTSKALWLPIIWLGIAGSRSVFSWFGIGETDGGSMFNIGSTLDGSPMDAAVYEALILAGLIVVIRRRTAAMAFLKASTPVILYFLYCLMSTLWSPIHGPAFKRWIKDLGDLIMVLIVMTEGEPIIALRRLFSRLGFILLPFSVQLTRYTNLGHFFDQDGNPMNTGVTTNKNSLGLIVFLLSLGALWNLIALLDDKKAPHRSRHLIAQVSVLLFGIWLLQMAHCATAVACFILGGGLMLATNMRAIRKRPGRIHALCLGIILSGAILLLFDGESVITGALGRRSDLGRTDIWKAAIAAADNPMLGTGFESFWNTNVDKVAAGLRGYWGPTAHNLVSAHNGYIELYLDLGWIGVCLIVFILITGYRRGVKSFRRDPQFGSMILAIIATTAFYSISEVGFRVLTPSWILLLIAVVGANGCAAGLIDRQKNRVQGLHQSAANTRPSMNEGIPELQWTYSSGVS